MNHVGPFRLRSRVVGGVMVALLLFSGAAAQIALSSLPANAIDCTLAAIKPNVTTDGASIRGNGQINCNTTHALTLTVTLQVSTPTGWQKVTSSNFGARHTVFLGGSTKFVKCGKPARDYRSKVTGSADNIDLGSDISNLTTTC
jgi:hypothetical protein